jgi:hypothetical protein
MRLKRTILGAAVGLLVLASVATGTTSGVVNAKAIQIAQYLFGTSGTDGQVWTKDATLAAKGKWAAAGGSGGGLSDVLEEHPATGTAVNFTSCITSTYDDYEFRFVGVIPSVDNSINARYSTDTGGSWITSGSYYWGGWSAQNTGTPSTPGNGETKFILAASVESTLEGITGTFTLAGPAIGSNRRQGAWDLTVAAPTTIGGSQGWGVNTGTTTIDAVQFFPGTNGTDTFASGEIRCYGIAN